MTRAPCAWCADEPPQRFPRNDDRFCPLRRRAPAFVVSRGMGTRRLGRRRHYRYRGGDHVQPRDYGFDPRLAGGPPMRYDKRRPPPTTDATPAQVAVYESLLELARALRHPHPLPLAPAPPPQAATVAPWHGRPLAASDPGAPVLKQCTRCGSEGRASPIVKRADITPTGWVALCPSCGHRWIPRKRAPLTIHLRRRT